MKKKFTLILCSLIIFTIFSPLQLVYCEDYNPEEHAKKIYNEALKECGLLDDYDRIVFTQNNTVQSFNGLTNSVSEIVSFIETENGLEDAYQLALKLSYENKNASLDNTKLLGFKINVNYTYFSQFTNDSAPYYRHGNVSVKAANNSYVPELPNFKCVYVSRGQQTNNQGRASYGFIECKSIIGTTTLHSGEEKHLYSGDKGNPYILKQSNSATYGKAFSGIAYKFSYGGRDYTGNKVILYDETEEFPYDYNYDL